MGDVPSITVCFYSKGVLVRHQFIDCYKFSSVTKKFSVTEYDAVKIKFSTEYDDSSSDEVTLTDEDKTNNSELDKSVDEIDFIDGH